MDCYKTDIVSLMQNGVRFHIPFYQRPYEWGEYQCQVLLDDLDLVQRITSFFTFSSANCRYLCFYSER